MKTRGMTFTGPSILAMQTCAECGVVSPGICPECGSPEKRKALTRRLPKRQPAFMRKGVPYVLTETANDLNADALIASEEGRSDRYCGAHYLPMPAPHQPGDIVYAREALGAMPHYVGEDYEEGSSYVPPPDLVTAKYLATQTPVSYAEGAKEGWCGKAMWQWKRDVLPSRFMPRWAARIWREVVAVRAERVQGISPEDIRAEGIDAWCDDGVHDPGDALHTAFRKLWDSLHAKRHGGAHVWEKNPVVFVYTLAVSSREAAEEE